MKTLLSNKRLPTDKRKPQEVKFVPTSRDIEILKALNEFRYLKTGQIKRLIFSDNGSMQSTTRRLKYLYHHNYISRLHAYVSPGKGSQETTHYLGNEGIKTLQALGESVRIYKKNSKAKYMFLQHACDLSEFRLLLTLALKANSDISLDQFIADFEMKAGTDKRIGNNRYKLFSKHIHPANKQSYKVYPDGLIHLSTIVNDKKYNQLYFLEIDRGTEGLQVIRDKITGYNIYLKQEIYKKFGNFQGFKVLIQTSSKKRATNIQNTLIDHEGAHFVLVTAVQNVNEKTILNEQIWSNHLGEKKSVLKRN